MLFPLAAHTGGTAPVPWPQRRLRRAVRDVAAMVAAVAWASMALGGGLFTWRSEGYGFACSRLGPCGGKAGAAW
ncbi:MULTISPECIES: hypothetical protein [Streptomyces]|uniref:hypothetical protein n=1 Tax=Streptomyces TaxID=1883 RepID=UPI001487BFB7|nr:MULTISPECIES: hypothetical protein [Streptomyces]